MFVSKNYIKEENFMNKNIELFENDVIVVEDTIKTFETFLDEAETRNRFQHSLNALREIDDNTFNKFKSVVEVLYTMSRTDNTTTFSSASFEETVMSIPTLEQCLTYANDEYERQACERQDEVLRIKEVEDLLDTLVEENLKPAPLYTPANGDNVFVYAMPDSFRYKFEKVFYLPKTGQFFGEYSGELQPKLYTNGIMCVHIKKFTHRWEPLKTKLLFVRELLNKCGALPIPNVTNKGKWVLSFANGNRLDFRLSNLLWTHGTGRGKASRDEEYLKRIIKDALDKLGSNASDGKVFNFLNKEKEVISVHMVGKLLPLVKKEVKEEEKEAANNACKILDINSNIDSTNAAAEDSKTDVMDYVYEWKKLFKHYPSKENIADIKEYLTKQGYIKDDFSLMAVKDIIKLLTGVSLSLKDLM